MTPATAVVGGLSRLVPRRNDYHPAWFTQSRRDALGWLAEHGFPTSKDEDWRYSRLGPILEAPFEPAAAGSGHRLSSSAIDELAGDLGGMRLVFVNGHLAPELSSSTALPEGVTVTSLASLLVERALVEEALVEQAERLRLLFAPPRRAHRHGFVALNAALAEDGAFVHLAADTAVDEPIQLVFVSDAGDFPLASCPRSVVLAGPRSRAVIVETYVGLAGGVYVTNAVTEVVLEEGASVEHYKVQDEAGTGFHLGHLDVRQTRASRFSSHSVALGSRVARHEVRVGLEGEGAEVSLNGLYMPAGDQQHDNPILIEHLAPRGTSRQLYKGVLDGRGQGIFNGRIIVHPGALGTDASQTNKNLLLSEHAEIDTRPRLEILADDVKCAHGAAVGRLDDDALFYLRSRGIPRQEARSLLISAFVHEMVELIDLEPLRAWVKKLVADRLSAGGGEVNG